jgi:histidine triad (HIT) family protein
MTLFEKIIARQIPADIVFEDDHCLAFRDIAPQAPVHILVVPKKPIPRVGEASSADRALLGHLLFTVAEIARSEKLVDGYRTVINNGANGGETVPHLHVHLLGGRKLAWPPG